MQDNGTQVAIQTIYRELDRARSLIKKHAQKDGEHTDEFEEDWTLVEEGEESESISHTFEVQQRSTKETSRNGGSASPALGSMVMRGAQKRNSESAYRN